MIRAVVLAATLLGAPAGAAVFEVAEDGSVERLDTPAPLRVGRPPAPVQRPPHVRPSLAAGQRAQAARPLVEQAAQQYEVSAALIDAIAHTESRYNQAAVSRVGAGGIMQLMPGTARELGVDPRDPAANIRGGTAYLRLLLNKFDGNVICTIAAYNAGPGAVSRSRCIPPYKETVSYVAAVLDRLSAAAN